MQLKISNISKTYGTTLALDGFTATLEPGIYALLGPNGSGKSTLINIITGNLKADSGEIVYVGAGTTHENTLKMGVKFREKLGFMPQYPGLYPNFTVEQFMWYMATLKSVKKAAAANQIPDILDAVELDDVMGSKISTLSGGMKQRLTLAQAVLGDPEILILDEPTAGLDPKQRITIRNYISKIALNKIVLIATHVVSDIEYIARNIIMLKKGVIVDNAPPHELTRKIEGKVWNIQCSENEVMAVQKNYRVTNISRNKSDSNVILRILAHSKPTDTAVPDAPMLEDYYLYIFGETPVYTRKLL